RAMFDIRAVCVTGRTGPGEYFLTCLVDFSTRCIVPDDTVARCAALAESGGCSNVAGCENRCAVPCVWVASLAGVHRRAAVAHGSGLLSGTYSEYASC